MKKHINSIVEEILELFHRKGDSQYGGECVSQLEHALQAATLAESEQASPELITAALLHDIGHLLHQLPEDAPDDGIDDLHEQAACDYLKNKFPPSVTEPVRQHVAAKRYLYAIDSEYAKGLSQPSLVSLELQGGPMSPVEQSEFEQNPYWKDAVRLRLWDDAAKLEDYATPAIEHFSDYLRQAVNREINT